jgi:hypothetical protein
VCDGRGTAHRVPTPPAPPPSCCSTPPCCSALPHPLQAATLLGQVALRSQQHQDELAGALGRIQKTLAASLFDEAPQTQYGAPPGALLAPAGLAQLPTDSLLCRRCRCHRPLPMPALFSSAPLFRFPARSVAGSLVGLSAFGVPVLLQIVVPSLARYTQMLQVSENPCCYFDGFRPCRLYTALGPLLSRQIPLCTRPGQMALRSLLSDFVCLPSAARGGRCAGPRQPARPHGAHGGGAAVHLLE